MKVFVSQEHAKLINEDGCTVALNIKSKEHVNAVKKYLEEASSADVIDLVTKLLKRKDRQFPAELEK